MMQSTIGRGAAAFVAALGLSLALAGPGLAKDNPKVGGAPMYATKNIIENAVNSKDHTTLVAAVKAAGLVETLSGKGPFMVFAPTNEAFAKLPKGTVETLLKPENKEKLVKILTSHVVGKAVMSSAIGKMVSDEGGAHPVKTLAALDALLADFPHNSTFVMAKLAVLRPEPPPTVFNAELFTHRALVGLLIMTGTAATTNKSPAVKRMSGRLITRCRV